MFCQYCHKYHDSDEMYEVIVIKNRFIQITVNACIECYERHAMPGATIEDIEENAKIARKLRRIEHETPY